ncbi:hypothetical protein F53441_13605 [Fusarium austroafricanum]|uniref:Zn(2)-C6 fungal-type domain-containing protein n=1 Tax=Fusarium austroafricanum TaxID=2364996 RepID=A0A8H4JLQ9_9HYPO|nr:hypothetical protein F53441_13605 [Fusarium austroafricanum]
MSTSSHDTTEGLTEIRVAEPVALRGLKRPRTVANADADEDAEAEAEAEAEAPEKVAQGRNRHRRITRACNECRRRKDRCGGQRPSCKSCTENSRTCSYGPSKKRGLRPGYVRAIEALLGLIVTAVDGSEGWICGVLDGNVQKTCLRVSKLQGAEIDTSVDCLLETWRKCSAAKKLNNLLSPEGIEFDEDGADSNQYFDTKITDALASLSSADNDLEAFQAPMDTNTTPKETAPLNLFTPPTSTFEPVEEILHQTPKNQFPDETNDSLDPQSHVPDLPKNWPWLLDLYFETTHCWFPISQKHELLRAAYTQANGALTTSANSLSSGELAFLHAVLAYASHLSKSLKSSPNINYDTIFQIDSPHDLTRTSLFGDPTTYDLGHVRALLVLSLFEMDQRHWDAAWATIGRAVYTSISIGLLSRNTVLEDPSSDDGVRRTLLGCATLETIVASRLNTRPYLTSQDISLLGPVLTDGIEEWEPLQLNILHSAARESNQQGPSPQMPGHVMSTFNEFIQIVSLLNDLMRQQKSLPPMRHLQEIMLACKENLITLANMHAVDLSPQALCLWIVSAATFEFAGSECPSERPDGYWEKVTWLVGLAEKRGRTIGPCSISPIVQTCIELLQQSINCHRPLYIDSSAGREIDLLKDGISRFLAFLQPPITRNPSLGINNNPKEPRPVNQSPLSLLKIQPMHGNTIKLPQTTVTHEPQTCSNLLPGDMPLSVSLHQPVSGRTLQTPTSSSKTTVPSSRDNLEDDGLFDCLATLDSTDWLANPPEFMQHLGFLEEPPKDIESIFDIGF